MTGGAKIYPWIAQQCNGTPQTCEEAEKSKKVNQLCDVSRLSKDCSTR